VTVLEVRRRAMRAMADETANLPPIALAPCCVLPHSTMISRCSDYIDM
jgi:hypothetical protein